MSEKKSRRRPINHGTLGGYRAHYRHGVPLCEPCRDAHRRSRGRKGPQKQAVCGTTGGYCRHLQRGEKTCAECRAAHAQAHRARLRVGLPDGDSRHGTLTGYGNYGCKCGPCKQAGAADNRRRREQRSTR